MKKLLFGLIAGSFLATLLLTEGCKLGSSSPSFTEFGIQIDSIQYPDTVVSGTPQYIKFYGTIGPSTCYSFSRFVGGVTGQKIDIAVLGKYTNNESNCASAMQYLNGDSLGVHLTTPGKFVIHVQQPTPPDIYDTIYVKSAVAAIH